MAMTLEELIGNHYKAPRNHGDLEAPILEEVGHNPLCGDVVKISVDVLEGGKFRFNFTGHGCSLSIACASIATELATGRSQDEVVDLCAEFLKCLKEPESDLKDPSLNLLSQIRKFPVRSKCVKLPFETISKAAARLGQNAQ